MTELSWVAFGLGGLLCLSNFYLSFLRYPLHKLRGGTKETYRWNSGIPLFGSGMVALSLLRLGPIHSIPAAAIMLIAIDTGGIHWFIGTMIYQAAKKKP